MKTLSAELLAALEDSVLRLAFFFEGRFTPLDGGDPVYVRIWTGDQDITFDGHTFLANGWFLGFSPVEDSDALVEAKGITISLSAVSEELRAVLLNTRQNEPGTLWLALLDESGAVIGSTIEFSGELETSLFDKRPESFSVALQYENRIRILQRAKERRWTDEQQRLDYPTDAGFQYMESIPQWSGVWLVQEMLSTDPRPQR